MRLIPLYAIIFVNIFIGIVPNSTATFHSEFETDGNYIINKIDVYYIYNLKNRMPILFKIK